MSPTPEQLRAHLLSTFPAEPANDPWDEANLLKALGSLSADPALAGTLAERLADEAADLQGISLAPEHAAILSWIDATLSALAERHLLDGQLQQLINKLAPKIAAQAICDRDFMRLGEHPLHRLLDNIYSGCLGWHSQLGRSGESLAAEL